MLICLVIIIINTRSLAAVIKFSRTSLIRGVIR